MAETSRVSEKQAGAQMTGVQSAERAEDNQPISVSRGRMLDTDHDDADVFAGKTPGWKEDIE